MVNDKYMVNEGILIYFNVDSVSVTCVKNQAFWCGIIDVRFGDPVERIHSRELLMAC